MPSKQGPRLHWRLSNLEHPRADLEKTVKDHLLNHAIQVLLPFDTIDKDLLEELNVQLVAMLAPDEGYQVIRASLADILAQVLSTAVLLQENTSFQALSLADRLESSHAVAITPDGFLRLAVSGEIHSRLGLTGVHSPSSTDRYNVSLDLRAQSLQPSGGDRYAQVLAKLRSNIPPQAFLARLEVNGQLRELGLPREALTPSYGTEAWMPLESVSLTLPGLILPPLSRDTFEQLGVVPERRDAAGGGGGDGTGGDVAGVGDGGDDAGADLRRAGGGRPPLTPAQEWRLRRAIAGLHTWLGALACGQSHTTCNDLLPDEVMPPLWEDAPPTFREEQERRLLGTAVSRMWKGILSQGQILAVMRSTSALVASRRVPWAAVNVWGFADAPVAWRGLEHGAAWGGGGGGSGGGAGESCYSVVFMAGGDYCIYRPLGANEMQAGSGS